MLLLFVVHLVVVSIAAVVLSGALGLPFQHSLILPYEAIVLSLGLCKLSLITIRHILLLHE